MKLGFWMLSSNRQFVLKTTSAGLGRPFVSGSGIPTRPPPRPLKKRINGLGLKPNIVANGKKRHDDRSKTQPVDLPQNTSQKRSPTPVHVPPLEEDSSPRASSTGEHVRPRDAPPKRERSQGRDRISQNSPRRKRSPKLTGRAKGYPDGLKTLALIVRVDSDKSKFLRGNRLSANRHLSTKRETIQNRNHESYITEWRRQKETTVRMMCVCLRNLIYV